MPALHSFVPPLVADVMVDLPMAYAPPVKQICAGLLRLDMFARLFDQSLKQAAWPNPDLHHPRMAPIASFACLDVPQPTTSQALADWLVIAPDRLTYLADVTHRHAAHRDPAVNHYQYAIRSKRDGRIRLIEAPKTGLKSLQRHILRGILAHVPVHPDSFGFVPGRNCLQGAARHVGEETVLCCDLKDFFPQIGPGRTFGLLRCLGYPEAVARLLTGICTTRTPSRVLQRLDHENRQTFRITHLPQGAPTSPAIANSACYGLDRRLSGLARSNNCNYSRYADDLCLSGGGLMWGD